VVQALPFDTSRDFQLAPGVRPVPNVRTVSRRVVHLLSDDYVYNGPGEPPSPLATVYIRCCSRTPGCVLNCGARVPKCRFEPPARVYVSATHYIMRCGPCRATWSSTAGHDHRQVCTCSGRREPPAHFRCGWKAKVTVYAGRRIGYQLACRNPHFHPVPSEAVQLRRRLSPSVKAAFDQVAADTKPKMFENLLMRQRQNSPGTACGYFTSRQLARRRLYVKGFDIEQLIGPCPTDNWETNELLLQTPVSLDELHCIGLYRDTGSQDFMCILSHRELLDSAAGTKVGARTHRPAASNRLTLCLSVRIRSQQVTGIDQCNSVFKQFDGPLTVWSRRDPVAQRYVPIAAMLSLHQRAPVLLRGDIVVQGMIPCTRRNCRHPITLRQSNDGHGTTHL
jgi:hypothetical protein